MNKRIIHTVFEEEAERVPNRIAVEETDRVITYRNLNGYANQLAHLLRVLGKGRGEIIGTILPAGIEIIAALLASFKSGGIYLPLDLAFAQKRFSQIFDQCEPGIIITNRAQYQAVEQLIDDLGRSVRYIIVLEANYQLSWINRANQHLSTVSQEELAATCHNPDLVNEPQDSNYLFYTSGSTGASKAILGCHDSLSHFIHWEIGEFGIDQQYRVSQLIQVTFDASFRDMLVPLCVGGVVCVPSTEERDNMAKLIEWLEASRITLLHGVPSMWRLITRELLALPSGRHRLPDLKHILLAGEPLYAKDVHQWRKAAGTHVELVNLYGPTETTMVKTSHRIREVSEEPSHSIHVGQPISNTAILILNNGVPCLIGEIGEVYIMTPFMTKGYFKNPALTSTVFVQNPLVQDKKSIVYKTGDLGRYLKDRSVEILGRIDDQVKVNGIRVELNEIKQALLTIPQIQEAEVIVHKNQDQPVELIVYYTGQPLDAEYLIGSLKKELNENIVPSYYVYLDELPLSLNGKVDKKQLPKPENVLIRDDDYEAPATETEQKLELIFQEVLGFSRVGRKISFFKIGGNSLKAMQVVSRIYKEFQVSLVLADLFTHPTLGQLAAVVERAIKKTYEAIRPVPLQPYYAVSQNQKRLWIMYQVEKGQTAFNMPVAYRLTGSLQLNAFQRAFDTLIQRHESLRTIFVKVDGEPKQKVLSSIPFVVDYVDLRQQTDMDNRAQTLADGEANTVFQLENGPLLRVKLLQLQADQFLFLLTMHHIVSDGWSMDVLVTEVLQLYNAYAQGKENPLTPLLIQYKDYSAWQHTQLLEGQLNAHRQYWLNELEGELPVLALPTDFARPAIQTFRGQTIQFRIATDQARAIRERCQQEDVTLFMFMLASVNVLLYRRTGQQDILIGTPTAGRHHKDLENQIGFYINMLALRVRFTPDIIFSDLLAVVKQTALGAYAHSGYPFIQLVEDLNLTVDLSRSSLFDVVVQMQDANVRATGSQTLTGITVESYRADYKASKYELTFNILDTEDDLLIEIEYNTDLFLPSTIDALKNEWVTLLDWLVESTSTPVGGLKKRLAEQSQVESPLALSLVAADVSHVHMPVHYRFEQVAAQMPDAVAIESPTHTLSYRMLNESANRVAHLLTKINPDREIPVGVIIPASSELTIALLGVFKAGGIYLPIDTAFAKKRIRQIVNECHPQVIITSPERFRAVELMFAELGTMPPYLIVLNETDATLWLPIHERYEQYNSINESTENLAPISKADEGNYIIYTSGSTGEGKAILGSHSGLSHFIDWEIREFGITERVRVSQLAQVTFDASLRDVFVPLCAGGTLCIPSAATKNNPTQLLNWLETAGVQLVHCVPSLAKLLVKELQSSTQTGVRLPELHYLLMAGEPLYVRDIQNWRRVVGTHVEVVNLYGTSETTLAKTFNRIGALSGEPSQMLSAGKAIADTAILVANDNSLCGVGEIGEIYIQTPYRSKGYYKNPALTNTVFVPNPIQPDAGSIVHRTGDYGRYLKDGSLEVLGRTDDQVKVNGIRLELNEVKQAILGLSGIEQAEVVVHKNHEEENELIGYYTGTVPESEIAERLRTELNASSIPTYFIRLADFPLTLNGKIDKKALPRPETILINDLDYEAPANEVEQKLEDIWKQVLNLSRIGRKVSFFRIGGNSLKAMQVTSRLFNEFGVSILLADLFTHPSIGQLAGIVASASQSVEDTIPPAPVQDYYELTHAQRRLWVMEQFEEEGAVLIMPSAYAFSGSLNHQALNQALTALIQRHESLRTVIVPVQGKPMQRILPAEQNRFSLTYVDLRGWPDGETVVRAMAAKEAGLGFLLAEGPLVRATLVQLDHEKYVFLFTLHHIIADGWSMRVFVDDLLAYYQAFSAGNEPTLAPLSLHYKDYAVWQNNQIASEKSEADRRYWLAVFEEEVPLLRLPFDFLRPALPTYNGDTRVFPVDPTLMQAIRFVCLQHDLTLFMVLLASVNILLYRYTGQTDIVIGFPVAGRSRKEFDDQIGLYINTLAIRNRFEPGHSCLEVLLQVKQTTLDAYKHAAYPLDLLIDELSGSRNDNRAPLFDVAIQLQNFESDDKPVTAVSGQIEPLDLKSKTAKHDLLFNFIEQEDALAVVLDYNTDLFREDTINQLGEDFRYLIGMLTRHPQLGIADATLLPVTDDEEFVSFTKQINKV